MEDSIFTKIIKGEIPSYKIYEDERTYAFLDIQPILPGHTLVIPKRQVEFVWDLDDVDYAALMETSRTIARHMRTVFDEPYVHARIVGIDVPHAHIHLVPFRDSSTLSTVGAKMNDEALADIASKLRIA